MGGDTATTVAVNETSAGKAMVAVDGKVEKSELSVMALEMVKFGVNPDAGKMCIRDRRIIVVQGKGIPPFCIRNKEVTRINAAQPFMLMVVQIGKTKREPDWKLPVYLLQSASSPAT